MKQGIIQNRSITMYSPVLDIKLLALNEYNDVIGTKKINDELGTMNIHEFSEVRDVH
jgi:hypothetical protein